MGSQIETYILKRLPPRLELLVDLGARGVHVDGLLAQVVVLEDLLRLRVHEAAVRELVERRNQGLNDER